MNLDEIKQLIQLVIDTGVAELEVERQGNRVRIRRESGNVHKEILVQAAPPQPAAVSAGTNEQALEASSIDNGREDPSLIYVKSPIVGTFYESPSPGSAPFVVAGDTVQPGQVLCIIESMKLMNEIESECAGVIVSRFVENGKPAEYGQTLFSIRPL